MDPKKPPMVSQERSKKPAMLIDAFFGPVFCGGAWYVTSRSRLVINVFQRYHKLRRGTVHAFKDKRLQCLELQESVKDALRDVFEEMTSQKPSFTMARLQAL